MHFVEVAVQNVRGFSPTGRFALKSGYLILKPPTPGEPAPLAALALAILYADGRGGEASFLARGQRAGKAAFAFVGRDGSTYRVLRELGAGGSLHRINPINQSQELITKDAAEALQFLRGQAGLVPRSTFEQVCCLQASQLPSRRSRSKAGGRSESKTGLPAISSAQAVAPAADVAAAEARLRELDKELALAREVDKVQYQLDELNSQLFELDKKLQSTDSLRQQLEQVEAEWQEAPTPESLGAPEDILERLDRYHKVIIKRDEALARIQSEREAEAERLASLPRVEPLTRNPAFWGSVGAGLLFLGLGLLLEGSGRYVALLDLPAFTAAAYVALRHVDELKQSQSVSRKDDKLAAREKKVLDEFEAEAAYIRRAMKAAGVDAPDDIRAVLGRRAELEAQVFELRNQLESVESDPAYRAAASRQAELRHEAEVLTARLLDRGSYVRDSREVERELSRVRESIALARSPAPLPAAAAPGASAPAGDSLEDPTPALFAQAADYATVDVPTLGGQLRERFLQYFTAMTDRRYTGVEWDREGRAVLVAAGGQRLPAGAMTPKDLDLYYLSLRMTVAEKLSARGKLPLLVEEVLSGLEETKLPLMGRMFKHLGTVTQVLHVTAHPGLTQLSEGPFNL